MQSLTKGEEIGTTEEVTTGTPIEEARNYESETEEHLKDSPMKSELPIEQDTEEEKANSEASENEE